MSGIIGIQRRWMVRLEVRNGRAHVMVDKSQYIDRRKSILRKTLREVSMGYEDVPYNLNTVTLVGEVVLTPPA
jgi:hypothetical protein